MENPIKCVKYNYTLESQNTLCGHFSSVLSISGDGEMLIITTIRPNKKSNQPQYILEADHKRIEQKRQ